MSPFDPKQYWEQRLSSNWGLQGVGLQGVGQGYITWLYKVRRRVFLRTVQSLDMDLRNSDVLDVGSGTGFYVELWKELGARSVVASDLTEVSVYELRRRFPEDRVVQLDIGDHMTGLPRRGAYHVVSAFDVLFHIVDEVRYQDAIENIHSLLAPGGWFIFSENFLHHGTERVLHQVSRSLEYITHLVHRRGFSIIKRVPMFEVMNDPIDQPQHFWRLAWRILLAPVRRLRSLGWVWGALLYPWEILLTATLSESPTTEIMVCRRQD